MNKHSNPGRQRRATHKARKAKAWKSAVAEFANSSAAKARVAGAIRHRGKPSLNSAIGAGVAMQQAAMAVMMSNRDG